MILGIEIAMTVMGLYMVFTGKTPGKHDLRHPHFRWLGGFLLTFFPVAIVSVLILGLAWAVFHPNLTPEELEKDVKWPAIGVEGGVALIYVVISILWERSISKKAKALREAAELTS